MPFKFDVTFAFELIITFVTAMGNAVAKGTGGGQELCREVPQDLQTGS